MEERLESCLSGADNDLILPESPSAPASTMSAAVNTCSYTSNQAPLPELITKHKKHTYYSFSTPGGGWTGVPVCLIPFCHSSYGQCV
jgi:hypothetical protein